MPPLHRRNFAFTRDIPPLDFGQRFIDLMLLAFAQPVNASASSKLQEKLSGPILVVFGGLCEWL
jgi:hypothetical protein